MLSWLWPWPRPERDARVPEPPQASPVAVRRADLLGLQPAARFLHIGQRRAPGRRRWGQHTAPLRGRGLEHDDVRPYQPGDDLRLVEWKVTARTGRTFTRIFREERERPLHLLVDFRSGMRFGSRGALKSVQAARVATLLAWASLLDGDRVGATVITDRGQLQRPLTAGRRGVLGVIRLLSEAHTAPVDAVERHTSLAPVFEALCRQLPSGSAVVPVSDFHGLDDGARRALGRLSRDHDLFGCFVYDPLEAEPPPPGRYPATDGRHRGTIDFADPTLRAAHVERFEARAADVRAAFVDHRAWLLRLATDHDAIDSVQRLLHARRRGRRR